MIANASGFALARIRASAAAAAAQPSAATLALPPGYVNQYVLPPATDKTANAVFYRQLPRVANYLAKRMLGTVTDTVDRNGIDHVKGNAAPTTQAAIARAISVYMLNIPYSSVQKNGWKTTLANILAMPLTTWNSAQGFDQNPGNNPLLPLPIQQRGSSRTSDAWAIHPAYFPFFFWNNALSFYRWLRYDPQLGFVFTNKFYNIFANMFFACFFGPQKAIPIEDWINVRYGGPAALDASSGDGLFSDDVPGQWLYYPDNMPANFTAKLQSFGNDIYSAKAHQNLMTDIAVAGAIAGVLTAGLSIAASGLTLTNGFSLFATFENSPWGVQNTALQDIAVFGKALNLSNLVGSMGLDFSSASDLAPAPSPLPAPLAPIPPAVFPGAPAVSVDSIPVDTTALAAIAPIDLSTIDIPPIDPASIPDIPITDPTSGIDLSTAITPPDVNTLALDPATVTAADTTLMGTDSSAINSAMSGAISATTNALGNFNLSGFIGAAAKIYATVTAAHAQGAAQAGAGHVANYPTPGTVTHLPDGSTAVVNRDGSTTVTSPTGAQQTIYPSGKIVRGGWASANPLSNPMVLGALALGAFLLLRK